MSINKILYILAAVALALILFFWFRAGREAEPQISNFEEKSDLIRISSPKPNQVIQSPLEITGEARGTWYFEADFPIKLFDGEGNELAQAIAQAQGEWMTENFVLFKAELKFAVPQTKTGTLVFGKNNPSGLPEQDDSLVVPVKFKE